MASESVAVRKIIQLDVQATGIERNTKSAADSLEKLNKIIATVRTALLALFAVDRIVNFSRVIVDSALQLEKLKAGLTAVTGSPQAAGKVFNDLQAAAAKLPATFNDLTESYIRLSRFGITPSIDALSAYANFSAGLGRDVNSFVEAMIDATTGEYERLKSLGIRVKDLGSELSVSFAGQTEVIKDNGRAITDYLDTITSKFTPALTPLATSLSNITDAWDRLKFAVVDGQLSTELERTAKILGDMVAGNDPAAKVLGEILVGFVSNLNNLVESFTKNGDELLNTINEISGALMGSAAGYVIGFLIGGPAGAAAFGLAGAIAGSAAGDAMIDNVREQIEQVSKLIIDLSGEIERAAHRIGFPQEKLDEMLKMLADYQRQLAKLQALNDALTQPSSVPSQSFPLTPYQRAQSPMPVAATGSASGTAGGKAAELSDYLKRLQGVEVEPKPSDVERLGEAWATAGNAFEGYSTKIAQAVPDMEKTKGAIEGIALAAEKLSALGNPFASLLDGVANVAQGFEELKKQPKDTTEAYQQMGQGVLGVLGFIGDQAQQLGIENATLTKALAMSTAVIQGAQAVIQVLATVPPPAGFALAGVVAGLVGAQLAIIANQSIPEKRQFGGNVRGGQLYRVNEAGAETYTDRFGKQYLIPGMGGGKVTPNSGGSKVTIHNHARAEVKAEEDSSGQLIVRIVDEAVKASKSSIMNEFVTGQGDLNKVLQRSYGLRRSL